MPTEVTQLEMFQEDLLNAVLGQILSPTPESNQENAEDTVEDTEEEG